MDLKELIVNHFRGIESLTWQPEGCVTCLIGAGDSTKTTILDAIDLVLGSRWAVQLSDTDFFDGDTSKSIVITATVGAIPPTLLRDDRFGLDLRGWNAATQTISDEPVPGCEPVLTLRFIADESLEPTWQVINDRRDEPRPISSRDREQLSVVRLSGDVDRHLAWGRGSALTRSTDDLSEVSRVIASANREARQAVGKATLTKLGDAAQRARQAAIAAGATAPKEYRPGLEAISSSSFSAQLSLHHGDIPVRAAGLATRRLNALAFQLDAVKRGATLLVDEVEHGLEPYRLRHLLRYLAECVGTEGRVILTTHSAVCIEELSATDLNVVRSDSGTTTVRRVTPELQALVRSNSEALLARRIVVCEGKTEMGLCRGLYGYWESDRGGLPVTHTGTALALGGGGSTGARAIQLRNLGYSVIVLADSDVPLVPDKSSLESAGITTLVWADGCSAEQRITRDLPLAGLQQFVDVACDVYDEGSVAQAVQAQMPAGAKLAGRDVVAWVSVAGEQVVRDSIGAAAKRKGWFKDVARGQSLGEIVSICLPQIPGTNLRLVLEQLGDSIYAQ